MANKLKNMIAGLTVAIALALPQKSEAQKDSYSLSLVKKLHLIEPTKSVWEMVPGARFAIKREYENKIRPFVAFSRYHKERQEEFMCPEIDIYRGEVGVEFIYPLTKKTNLSIESSLESSYHFHTYNINGYKPINNYRFAGTSLGLNLEKEISKDLSFGIGFKTAISTTRKKDIENPLYQNIAPKNYNEISFTLSKN